MQELSKLLKEFENLPRFPDGRIDYSNSNKALVLTCFVKFKDKILILKRSNAVSTYKGKWCTVAGYIDEEKPVSEKAFEELREELGIMKKDVAQLKTGMPYEFFDPEAKKTWIVFPVLAELKKMKKMPDLKLDWEHSAYKWIKPEELSSYDVVPNLDESLRRVMW